MSASKRRRLLTLEAKRGLSVLGALGERRLKELEEEDCEQLFGPNDPTGDLGCLCTRCEEESELEAALKWLRKKLGR